MHSALENCNCEMEGQELVVVTAVLRALFLALFLAVLETLRPVSLLCFSTEVSQLAFTITF